jgi:hypothetical protein
MESKEEDELHNDVLQRSDRSIGIKQNVETPEVKELKRRNQDLVMEFLRLKTKLKSRTRRDEEILNEILTSIEVMKANNTDGTFTEEIEYMQDFYNTETEIVGKTDNSSSKRFNFRISALMKSLKSTRAHQEQIGALQLVKDTDKEIERLREYLKNIIDDIPQPRDKNHSRRKVLFSRRHKTKLDRLNDKLKYKLSEFERNKLPMLLAQRQEHVKLINESNGLLGLGYFGNKSKVDQHRQIVAFIDQRIGAVDELKQEISKIEDQIGSFKEDTRIHEYSELNPPSSAGGRKTQRRYRNRKTNKKREKKRFLFF